MHFVKAGCYMNELIKHIDKLHTTELGVIRIRRNLTLENINVVEWCKSKITDNNAQITRQGKNWYATIDNVKITINAHSYTIITAHKIKV